MDDGRVSEDNCGCLNGADEYIVGSPWTRSDDKHHEYYLETYENILRCPVHLYRIA